MSEATATPKVVVVVVDGLPADLLEQTLPDLPFLRSRLPYAGRAVSCFPSTTGPAYYPLVAGCTPGRANVPGIRWFDRTAATRTRFPHRGLRSYVGPDVKKAPRDTRATTFFARHAWPCSSPIAKDSPRRCRETSRDAAWALAHFFHTWDQCDRRTAWALGKALGRGREIVFAVFPAVDEFGHTFGIASGKPHDALVAVDGLLERRLGGFEGEIVLTADHGLTETHTHLDLRALVEQRVGPTLACPLVGKPNPSAVVCESGNAMANVYLRGERCWRERPSVSRCREVAADLLELEGVDSVAIRGPFPGTAELWAGDGVGEVGFSSAGLFQRGDVFRSQFSGASPREALALSAAEEHPDAAFALTSLFASERAGDLLVSAKAGYDLRDRREWPEHRASHGALHRSHTIVPAFSSAPLPRGPLRTLDLFSYTLDLAGVPLADYPQSDASRVASGCWRPEVWR